MRYLKFLVDVFRNYTFQERVFSVLSICVIVLVYVKLMIFPYGFFHFGTPDIYTEGLVSTNGIQNINPLFVEYNESDREVSRLVFSGLMKYDPDKEAVVDDMAVMAINEDKTEYTFTLRQGIKWHDGEPVTADDVYYTFHDVVLDPSFQNEILKANFAGIEIELIDEMTLKFVLEKPNVFFATNLTVGILPEHILSDVPVHELLQNEFNRIPVGTGPYMVTEPVTSFPDGRMQVTLSRSPNYYGQMSEILNVRFIVFPTTEDLFKGINAVNGVVKVFGEDVMEFSNYKRFDLEEYELPQYTAVFMNMESEILKGNHSVRLALSKAIDKEELIAQFEDKVAIDTPLLQLNQGDWVHQPSKDQAMGSLKEGGYSYGEDDVEHVGIRYDESGNALELKFVARMYDEGTLQFEETGRVVAFLQEAWESVGVDIKVELLPAGQFTEAVMSRSYDLLLVGHNLGYNFDTYSYWHSTQADPKGQNFSNYTSFHVDTLIENIRSLFDIDARAVQLNFLAEKLKEDIPAIFLYRPVYYYASDSKISGVDMDGVSFPSDRFSGIENWVFE